MNVIYLIFFSFFIFFSQLFAGEERANVTNVQSNLGPANGLPPLVRNLETADEKLARQKIKLAEITSQREKQKQERIRKIEEFAATFVDQDKQEFEMVNFEIIDMELFDSECNLGDIKVTLMYSPKKEGMCSLLFEGNDFSKGNFTRNFNFKDDEKCVALYASINSKKKFGLQLEAADFSLIKFPINEVVCSKNQADDLIATEMILSAQESVFKSNQEFEEEREDQDLELIKKIEEFSAKHAKPFGRQGAQRFDVINANRIDAFENPKGLLVTLAYNFEKLGVWNISFSSEYFKQNFTRVFVFAEAREGFEERILSDMISGKMFGLKLEAFGWEMIKFSFNVFELTGKQTISIPKPKQIQLKEEDISAKTQKKLEEEKNERDRQEEIKKQEERQLQLKKINSIECFLKNITKYDGSLWFFNEKTSIKLARKGASLDGLNVKLICDAQEGYRLIFQSSLFSQGTMVTVINLGEEDEEIIDKINKGELFNLAISGPYADLNITINEIEHKGQMPRSINTQNNSLEIIKQIVTCIDNNTSIKIIELGKDVKASAQVTLNYSKNCAWSLSFQLAAPIVKEIKLSEEQKAEVIKKMLKQDERIVFELNNKYQVEVLNKCDLDKVRESDSVSLLQWCKQFPVMTTGICFACCAAIILMMHKNNMFNRFHQYC